MAVDLLEDLRRITEELDRLEDKRRETEVRYRALIEVAPLAIGVVDTHGTLYTANEQMATVYGYESADAMAGMDARSLICPDDLEAFMRCLLALKAGEALRGYEMRSVRKDGTHFPIIANVAAMGKGEQIAGYETIVEDIAERKRVEDAIRRSEEIHRLIVENASDIIYTLNDAGIFQYVSPAWERLLGYTEDEVVGHSFTEFVHADDVPAFQEFLAIVHDTHKPHNGLEYRVRCKNGEWVWHTSHASPFFDVSDKTFMVLGIAHDVTERRRVDEIVRAERQIFTAGPVVAFRWRNEPGWPVEYVSSNVTDQFGYLPEAFLSGKLKFADIVKPEDLKSSIALIDEYRVQRRSSYELEYRIKNAAGAWRWVLEHAMMEYDVSGAIVSSRGYILDTTDRHNALDALVESEMRYRAVVEDQTEKICRWLPDGTLTFVNQSYCAYFGMTEAQLLGRNYSEFLPEDAMDIMRDVVARMRAGEDIISSEHRVVRNGRVGWQRWTDRALRGEGGYIREVQSVGHDITQRKEIEFQLRDSEQRLRMVFDLVSDAIIIVDERTCEILDVNINACALFGYEEHEMLLMHHYDIMVCNRDHHLGSGAHDVRYRHRDGTEFNAMTTVVYFAQGERKVATMTLRIQHRFAWDKLRKLDAEVGVGGA